MHSRLYLYPDTGDLLIYALESSGRGGGVLDCTPSKGEDGVNESCKTKTKWFFSTRLETRTKESTSIASVRVVNLYAE